MAASVNEVEANEDWLLVEDTNKKKKKCSQRCYKTNIFVRYHACIRLEWQEIQMRDNEDSIIDFNRQVYGWE